MARRGFIVDTVSKAEPVAVSGVGAVSGYGWGRKLLQQGLLSGVSAVRAVAGVFPQLGQDRLWVARVADEGLESDGESRGLACSVFCVRQAVEDARDRGWRPGKTVGIVHCLAPDETGLMPSMVVTEAMREFGFHGPVLGVTAMTASGIAGLLTAKGWIDQGVADDVVVLVGDLSVTAERCQALAETGTLQLDVPAFDVCRPFQEGSRGFVAGEATVAMVVSGRPDGAYGEILGGAMTYDEVRPAPFRLEPTHVRRAFLAALDAADVVTTEVAYLNAHGSGIPGADGTEAGIFDELFSEAAGIFSVKPLVGHCLEAAGAVELYASLCGFETGVIPAPPRLARGHPRLLDGPTATLEGLVAKASLCMSGHNAVIVLGPPLR